jgi:hypothetical protein
MNGLCWLAGGNMQNEEDWDDMFCAMDMQKSDKDQESHFPGELEDDVEVFFMMMLGLG